MTHIKIHDGVPGILGAMTAYPETERQLKRLRQVLLRGPSSLAPAERATDEKTIHETVLIAAAYCMHNRYEDGLATGDRMIQPSTGKAGPDCQTKAT